MSGHNIVVVGDGIIDEITHGDGEWKRHPGGAALNVAKGTAILGNRSTLIFNSASDDLGDWLRTHLSEHGVRPLGLPTAATTGIARAHFARPESEPTYRFNDAIMQRHYAFTDESAVAIEAADSVALTAFPLDDSASVDDYLAQLAGTRGFRAVDPNPRPALLSRRNDFRRGFERVALRSHLVKLSDEDITALYDDGTSPVHRLVAEGVAVVLTHGSRGATLYLSSGEVVHEPVPTLPDPIVDTIGAGDATLAVLLSELAGEAVQHPDSWRSALRSAMEVAAATCRSPGGTLRLTSTPGPVQPAHLGFPIV